MKPTLDKGDAVKSYLVFPLIILFAAAANANQHTPPLLVFGSNTVSVTGVTPGADVYLFGVAREALGYYNHIVPRELILHDGAKAGRVDYALGRSVPLRSIWFAVDLASGLPVAGTPPGYTAVPIQLDGRHLKRDTNGDIARLAYAGTLVDIILVRPGDGVWGASIGLHSANDEGSDERDVEASVLQFTSRVGTAAAAPAKLKNGDVVFLMNSYTAQYSYAVIGGNQ
jgi:hypothetical protein